MICFFPLIRGRFLFKTYVLIFVIIIITLTSYLLSMLRLHLTLVSTTSNTLVPTTSNTFPKASRHLSKLVTVVFRHFEDFESDVANSVQSFASAFPNMPIVVISESLLYPPLAFSVPNQTLRNVRVVSLELRLNGSSRDLNPLWHITTEYVLFVPDSTRISRRVLQQAVLASADVPLYVVTAVPVGNTRLNCQKISWNYAEWTLKYSKVADEKFCHGISGQHALLIRTSLLHLLPKPFMLPFPEALYLQSSAKGVKVQILSGKFAAGHNTVKSAGARQMAARKLKENRIKLYKQLGVQLGVKVVIREDGRMQWYGCKRDTPRCFPSVRGTPSYILTGRNTPPCCRHNMRRVVGHVLRVLKQAGARCWLETTSLLGAVLRADLLPWVEYAEIGINSADVSKVPWLQRGGADADGYVWERATKGHYYRVAFSAINRVYTLVLPFTARNGSMWPENWVLRHQKEFPEKHIRPITQVSFVGREAPSPNDARAFLDHKLGASSIERCQKLGSKLLYP